MKKQIEIQKGDLTGIVNSSICLLHCIAPPLLTGIGWLHNPGFDYIFVILSFSSVWAATQNTDHTVILLILWLSFWIFLFSLFFHEEYSWLNYFNYLSSIALIVGHIVNIRYCKKCNGNEDNAT